MRLDSREAYEAYLLGRKHFDVMNAKNVAISVEYFEQAVTLDPGYVRGHARLASAYRLNGMLGSTTRAERQEWTERSREAANKAVDLDSDSADALSGLALVTVNPELQAQLLERALELEPNWSCGPLAG
jgi:tetratricopeptide (TPR) repeat protein